MQVKMRSKFEKKKLYTQHSPFQNFNRKKVISHGPKFREPQHINWKHNFKIIMDVSNEVDLYVVLLEVLLFMPNSLIKHSK
jgi:hypothetical protein